VPKKDPIHRKFILNPFFLLLCQIRAVKRALTFINLLKINQDRLLNSFCNKPQALGQSIIGDDVIRGDLPTRPDKPQILLAELIAIKIRPALQKSRQNPYHRYIVMDHE